MGEADPQEERGAGNVTEEHDIRRQLLILELKKLKSTHENHGEELYELLIESAITEIEWLCSELKFAKNAAEDNIKKLNREIANLKKKEGGSR